MYLNSSALIHQHNCIYKIKNAEMSPYVRHNHPLSVISLNRANLLYLKNMETRFTCEELSQSHF